MPVLSFLCTFVKQFEKKRTMSLNKVLLIGFVGRDPDVRYFDSGSAVANFPLATSERGYTLPNGTVVPERTEWHNVVVRKDQVPFVERWVKKGSGVFVEGKLRTRSYDDASGTKHYITEVHANRVEFFNVGSGTSSGSGQQAAQPQNADPSAMSQQPSAAQPSGFQQPVIPQIESSLADNSVDDLPF